MVGIILADYRIETSRVYRFAKNIQNQFPKFEILSPGHYPLKECLGCKSCFKYGICPLDKDKEDHAVFLKEKLTSADIIIIVCPVYAHNVSSDLKRLIDRISYWLHLFGLLGKAFLIITTTASNGSEYVNSYLNKIFSCLGAYRLYVDTFSYIDTDETTKEKFSKVTDCIQKYIDGEIKFQTSEIQNQLFIESKANFLTYPKTSYEYQYWLKHGFFQCKNLQEVYEHFILGGDKVPLHIF